MAATHSATDEAVGCVTGRFQPVHQGHLELFDRVLSEKDLLLVAITNPDPGARAEHPDHETRHRPEANPFTYYQRHQMVRTALVDAGVPLHRFDIVPFPLHDPDRVHGYVPISVDQYVRVFSPWESAKAVMLERYGYTVVEIDGDAATRVSSTDIREAIATGSEWRHHVSPGVATLVDRAMTREHSDVRSPRP